MKENIKTDTLTEARYWANRLKRDRDAQRARADAAEARVEKACADARSLQERLSRAEQRRDRIHTDLDEARKALASEKADAEVMLLQFERVARERDDLRARLAAYNGVPTGGPGSHKQDLDELRLCRAKLASTESRLAAAEAEVLEERQRCYDKSANNLEIQEQRHAALARVRELEKANLTFAEETQELRLLRVLLARAADYVYEFDYEGNPVCQALAARIRKALTK